MRNATFLLVFSLFLSLQALAQNKGESTVRYDGLYIAKTIDKEETPFKNGDRYMYLRFYEDGTVYSQTVNSYAPGAVSKWFGKEGHFERCGKVKIKKSSIKFNTDNSKSDDRFLEGAMKTNFKGEIISSEILKLEVEYNDGSKKLREFKFVEFKK